VNTPKSDDTPDKSDLQTTRGLRQLPRHSLQNRSSEPKSFTKMGDCQSKEFRISKVIFVVVIYSRWLQNLCARFVPSDPICNQFYGSEILELEAAVQFPAPQGLTAYAAPPYKPPGMCWNCRPYFSAIMTIRGERRAKSAASFHTNFAGGQNPLGTPQPPQNRIFARVHFPKLDASLLRRALCRNLRTNP
jgi:hypothetical protein